MTFSGHDDSTINIVLGLLLLLLLLLLLSLYRCVDHRGLGDPGPPPPPKMCKRGQSMF